MLRINEVSVGDIRTMMENRLMEKEFTSSMELRKLDNQLSAIAGVEVSIAALVLDSTFAWTQLGTLKRVHWIELEDRFERIIALINSFEFKNKKFQKFIIERFINPVQGLYDEF